MRDSTTSFLQCPRCGERGPTLRAEARDESEAREGAIACGRCGAEHPLRAGIAHMLPEAAAIDAAKTRERDGWNALGRTNAGPARDAFLPELPYRWPDEDETDHWRQASLAFPAVEAMASPLAGRRILDLGAAFCWASNRFARAGANVVAADFNPDPEFGLGKADFYFRLGCPHFERVCCDGEALPFADGTFDAVFCCATIHHFVRPEKLLAEAARVLAPGGRFFAINESFRSPFAREEEALGTSEQTKLHLSYGINEQAFTHGRYRRWIEEAGLRFRAVHVRWDVARDAEGRVAEVAPGAGLRSASYAISDGSGGIRRLAKRIGLARVLRLPGVAGLARPAAFRFTGAYRILVGEKPGAVREGAK